MGSGNALVAREEFWWHCRKPEGSKSGRAEEGDDQPFLGNAALLPVQETRVGDGETNTLRDRRRRPAPVTEIDLARG